ERGRADIEADERARREVAEQRTRKELEAREDELADDAAHSGADKKKDKGKKKKKKKKHRDGDDAPSSPAARSDQAPQDLVRLFVNRGASDGYDERRIRALILDAAGLQGAREEDVLRVQLRRTHAFVEAKQSIADASIAAAEHGIQREEKPVTIERARTR